MPLLYTVKSSAPKWKSSFKPIDDPDDNTLEDRCSDNPERYSMNWQNCKSKTEFGLTVEFKSHLTLIQVLNCLLSSSRPELYDPYNPVSPDSDPEISQDQDNSSSLFTPDDNPEPLSVKTNKTRWDIPATASRPPDRDERSPEDEPGNTRALSLGHRLPERTCDIDTEPFVSPGYDSVSRSLDHRVGSPDRHIHGPSHQKFPASYRPPRTNESERAFPDYRGEVLATVVFVF